VKYFVLTNLLALLIPMSSHAATYYVSPGGVDVGPGAESAPWRSLQRAANSAKAGDTIIIHKGKYAGFVMGWDKPTLGRPDAIITFQAEPGVTIISRNGHTPDGIDLEPGCGYIVIEGFAVNNASGSIRRAGIRVTGSDHVSVINNDCENNGNWGIFASHANDLLIDHNITAHSKVQHGIYVSNSAERATIRNNTTFGNPLCGIHLNGDASQGGNGLISDTIIENNIVYDNGTAGGAAINGDGLTDSVVRGNLLYDNHSSGIALFDEDAAHGSTGNFVVNNTLIMASDSRWAININRKSTGNVVCNNIIFDANPATGSIQLSDDSRSGFVSDYNILEPRFSLDDDILYGLPNWQKAGGQDIHSKTAVATDIFVSPADHDFHLKPGCVALSAGSASLAKNQLSQLDLEGNAFSQVPDIGAYQLQAKR
jgi:parallel beta-helix repeat protein